MTKRKSQEKIDMKEQNAYESSLQLTHLYAVKGEKLGNQIQLICGQDTVQRKYFRTMKKRK